MKQTRIGRPVTTAPATSFDAFQDFGNSACLLLDAAGVILEANREASELLGRPVEDLVGSPFGVCLHESTRMLIDVVSPHVAQHAITVRAIPAYWSPERAIVVLEPAEATEGVTTVAQAARLAVFEARQSHTGNLEFATVQLPEVPAIAEATEIFRRCLSFLQSLASPDAATISIMGLPVNGNRTMAVFRMTMTDLGEDSQSTKLPWNDDPFALVEEVGGKLTCLSDFPVITLQLRIPNAEQSAK